MIMQPKLPISKKEQLKERIKLQQWVKALTIAKSFIKEFSDDEKRIVQIAHECKDESRKNFYKGLGIDVDKNYNSAILILKKYK